MGVVLDIATIVLIVVLIILRIFVPSFIKAKAENLAKKQDIEELTKLVKEVESKFDERLHEFKANVDLSAQMRLNLHDEERRSLIDLHLKVIQYYNYNVDVFSGVAIFFEDQDKIFDHLRYRRVLNEEVFIAFTRFVLITNIDTDLHSSLEQLIDRLNQFGGEITWFAEQIVQRKGNIEKLHELMDSHVEKAKTLVAAAAPLLAEVTILMREHIHAKTMA